MKCHEHANLFFLVRFNAGRQATINTQTATRFRAILHTVLQVAKPTSLKALKEEPVAWCTLPSVLDENQALGFMRDA